MKLRELLPGEKVRISGYQKSDNHYRKKLLSMGLTRGTEVKLIKVAPFGDPVEIETRGYSLSLRKGEAEILNVEKIS